MNGKESAATQVNTARMTVWRAAFESDDKLEVDGRTDGRIGKFEKQHRTHAAAFFRLDVCCYVAKWLTKKVSCASRKVKPRLHRSKDREKNGSRGL